MNWTDAEPPGLPKSLLRNSEGSVIAEIGSHQEIKDIKNGRPTSLTLYINNRVHLKSFATTEEAREAAEIFLDRRDNERLLEIEQKAPVTLSRKRDDSRNVEVLLSVLRRVDPDLMSDAPTLSSRVHQELAKYDVVVPRKSLSRVIGKAFTGLPSDEKEKAFDNIAKAIASTVYIKLPERLKVGGDVPNRMRGDSDKSKPGLGI